MAWQLVVSYRSMLSQKQDFIKVAHVLAANQASALLQVLACSPLWQALGTSVLSLDRWIFHSFSLQYCAMSAKLLRLFSQ